MRCGRSYTKGSNREAAAARPGIDINVAHGVTKLALGSSSTVFPCTFLGSATPSGGFQ